MDETTIGLIYPILACWMKRGQQKRLPMTTGRRQFQYLAGVLNWRTQDVHCQPLAKMNSEALITYFEWLFTEVYPDQKLVLVMDNASWHCSAATQAFLALYEHRVVVLWLPPYSPDMNPLERFWKHLKANACANKLYRSLAHLIGGIFNFLDEYADPNYSGRLSFSKDL